MWTLGLSERKLFRAEYMSLSGTYLHAYVHTLKITDQSGHETKVKSQTYLHGITRACVIQ